jgi:hypothetical protein
VNCHLSRHIDLQWDTQDSNQFLISTWLTGARLLTNHSFWQALAYPSNQKQADSNLIQRAQIAGLLDGAEPSSLACEIARVLKRQGWRDIEEARSALKEQLRPRTSELEHYLWRDPHRLIDVMIDHVQLFLQLEAPATRSYPVEFLRRSLGRPLPKEEYEQQPCTLATTLERVALMEPNGPVLLLGDDDLLSIALSILYPELEIEVLEIDEQLLEFLKPRVGPRVKLQRCDLTHGLPTEFRKRFSTLYTDPMYAEEGMLHFVQCCADGLTQQGKLFFSTCPSLIENPVALFQAFESAGLKVMKHHRNFNRYPFPDFARKATVQGLTQLGAPAQFVSTMLEIPYLYADLLELRFL